MSYIVLIIVPFSWFSLYIEVCRIDDKTVEEYNICEILVERVQGIFVFKITISKQNH